MKNHINELFDSFTPKEEQKANILHKIMNERERRTSINSKYFYGWRGFLRPVIAGLFCLLIAICVFAFRGRVNTITVYAYGENVEITNNGVMLSTGVINDNGEMKGQLMQLYVKGKNIEKIRFSCKNQYIDFTDWTESRSNFSMEKQFTIHYGKKVSDYDYLVVNWNPENTIRELTDKKNNSIVKLSPKLRNDIIVMEITFMNGKKETKAVVINIRDDGKIFAKLQDYVVDPKDDFVLNPQSKLQKQTQKNNEEKLKNTNGKHTQEEIESAKEVARKYYSKTVFKGKIDSIEYLEDLSSLSSYIHDEYKNWNIIAFKVYETLKNPGLPRIIILAKENDKKDWVVINEGY